MTGRASRIPVQTWTCRACGQSGSSLFVSPLGLCRSVYSCEQRREIAATASPSARDTRACVYCAAVEPGNERGLCRDGFPHCFQFDWSTAVAAQDVKG